MKNGCVGIAILGAGAIADVHVQACLASPDLCEVLAVCDRPLLAPDLPVETDEGFRQNVIFPCGMILEDDGEVKIYYGASDTCVCLATANVRDLLDQF